jgi:hypothetical protein
MIDPVRESIHAIDKEYQTDREVSLNLDKCSMGDFRLLTVGNSGLDVSSVNNDVLL